MGDAGSDEWPVFRQWQIISSGYGAQQLAACLLAKWHAFLTPPECAHHTACGTWPPSAAWGCERDSLPRLPVSPCIYQDSSARAMSLGTAYLALVF